MSRAPNFPGAETQAAKEADAEEFFSNPYLDSLESEHQVIGRELLI